MFELRYRKPMRYFAGGRCPRDEPLKFHFTFNFGYPSTIAPRARFWHTNSHYSLSFRHVSLGLNYHAVAYCAYTLFSHFRFRHYTL